MKNLALLVVVWTAPVRAQAPQSADMWRVATATLAAPAALQWGPTGAFWAAWRPALQIGLGLGRYSIAAARSNGLNGLGALYRFALDVALR